jgi:glycogen debranching enzyme
MPNATRNAPNLSPAQRTISRTSFNRKFVVETDRGISFAYALDGHGMPHVSARSSMGHLLWAVYRERGPVDGILDHRAVHALVERIMREDLFEKNAGLRTLSRKSKKFEANSYHNGSIWPHDSAIVSLGLERHGYLSEAKHMREAILRAFSHFETPIELFVYDHGRFTEYTGEQGEMACRTQAWSAAALCAILIEEGFLFEEKKQSTPATMAPCQFTIG